MKRAKKIIGFALILTLFLLTNNSVAYAYDTYITECESKISPLLTSEINNTNTNDEVLVSLWFDTSEINEAIEEKIFKLENDFKNKTKNAPNDKKLKYLHEYRSAKKNVYSNAYKSLNTNYISLLDSGFETVYISKYSPSIIAKMNSEQISSASRKNYVTHIDSGTVAVESELDISRQVIRANQIQNSALFGYTGNGVRVGILDAGIPDINSESLRNANLTLDPLATSVDAHATIVATVIAGQPNCANAVGIAPDVSLFCTAGRSLKSSFDWFVENNIDIVNISLGYGYVDEQNIFHPYVNSYTDSDKTVDFYASTYSIIVVKSAGNEGSNGITSPGMAYNAITVAAINDKNTTTITDDIIYGNSSYILNTSNTLASKPDISAPGENIYIDGLDRAGTSYAAPHVTGAIALMGEHDALVLTSPSLAKAIIATGTFSGKRFTPVQQSGTNSYKHFGAGIINCSANAIIINNVSWDYTVLYEDENYFDVTISLTANSNCRIALAFENMITSQTSNNETVYTKHVNNIDLKIYNPSGSLVASSTTSNNNLEIVDFTPTVSGQYTMRICRADYNDLVDVRVAYAYT